jgi:SMC interacting uncharacterized protein involved in chromosome segregation
MTKITKAEYEALPDSLKTKFTADGDGFALVEEDIEGLKKSKAEILQEKKDLQTKLAELEKFKTEHETLQATAEQEKLAAEGEWKELEKRMREQQAKELADRDTKIAAMFESDASKQLALAIAKHKGFEDMAEDLSLVLRSKHIKPVDDNGKVTWKSLDDTKVIDLDEYVPSLSKNGYGRYFQPNGAAGSGASQSTGQLTGELDLNTMTAEQKLDYANAQTTK